MNQTHYTLSEQFWNTLQVRLNETTLCDAGYTRTLYAPSGLCPRPPNPRKPQRVPPRRRTQPFQQAIIACGDNKSDAIFRPVLIGKVPPCLRNSHALQIKKTQTWSSVWIQLPAHANDQNFSEAEIKLARTANNNFTSTVPAQQRHTFQGIMHTATHRGIEKIARPGWNCPIKAAWSALGVRLSCSQGVCTAVYSIPQQRQEMKNPV